MEIKNLLPTHNDLRNHSAIEQMAHFVECGGCFDIASLTNFSNKNNLGRVSPLIQITRFEDNSLYVHDGHHRVVACLWAGRVELHPSEYELNDWTYAQYKRPNIATNWFTPFDPITEVRLPDFVSFKYEALAKKESGVPYDEIIKWIINNKDQYVIEREIYSMAKLAMKVLKDHGLQVCNDIKTKLGI